MANPFQQQVRLRKVVYVGLILALFTFSIGFRKFLVEEQASNLLLRETARGEVELSSSAVRLILTGSRGLATTFLWAAAIKAQEKHEWNEVELLVNSITKLQPYFITPWLFQSWNLAFNVAVECDRPNDKYYYISRGVDLLAKGESRNSPPDKGTLKFPGNPEMRHYLGFTYQLKIGTSDEKETMRCLLDMSCIDPVQRDPNLLWDSRETGREVNLKKFKEFCEKYPRLVRRLREQIPGYDSPTQVVQFLAENYEVPSRFEKPNWSGIGDPTETKRKDRQEQFPILPPQLDSSWPNPKNPELSHESLDVFLLARTWYQYAQVPLPPPTTELGIVTPDYDQERYRIPRRMAITIFRGYPARGQAFIGENLEAEGWFDGEGWNITDWFDREVGNRDEEVRVGQESKYHAGPAWAEAYRMYLDYGMQNGLYITPEERTRLDEEARPYREKFKITASEQASLRPDLRETSLAKSYNAHQKLFWNRHYRSMNNYDAHLHQSEAEKNDMVVRARKLFFEFEQLRKESKNQQALDRFEQAVPLWLGALLQYPNFRVIPSLQEDVYETELKYLNMSQRQNAGIIRPVVIGVAQMGIWPYLPLNDMLTDTQKSGIIPIRRVRGPLDMVAVYEGEHSNDLRRFLLAWTQGAQPGWKIMTPEMASLYLTTTTGSNTVLPSSWAPLIPESTISIVRDRLGIDLRDNQEKK